MEKAMASGTIHTRGLTSFFTLFGFLIMSITGLVLYIVPEGRVAYWITWEFAGLTKTDWGNIHILSSILFIAAGGFHIYFNWKPLINYFKDKARRGVKLRRELAITSVLSVWIIVAAIWPFPPFSYLLDLNTWVKQAWVVEDEYEPPFGHAELLSLETFAEKMDIDLPMAVEELRSKGLAFDGPDETLEEIAKNNGVSPMDVYLLIRKFEPAPDPEKLTAYTPQSIEVEFAGTGFGNRSIASISERLGLDTNVVFSRLTEAGLNVGLEQTIKSAATVSNTEAIEIMKVILLDGYKPAIE